MSRTAIAGRARWAAVLALAAALLVAVAFLRTRREGGADRRFTGAHAGIQRFVSDDFGGITLETLETNALPYKVLASALLMREERHAGKPIGLDALPDIFQRYGFLSPERIANWPEELPEPRSGLPLGIVAADISSILPPLRIHAVNLGCAACHAGVLYDAEGRPTREVWLGLPNTSIDLERYTRDMYDSLGLAASDLSGLVGTLGRLFPDTGWRERMTLRRFVLPRVVDRMRALQSGLDAPAPFSNGGPGRTNGVAALKLVLGLLPRNQRASEWGFTSIPDLASRGLRSSLLYDGFYAPVSDTRFAARSQSDATPAHLHELAAIVTFFTVPTMGMAPQRAEAAVPRVAEIMTGFLAHYRPPRFPGPIAEAKALSGREVYVARCAPCHGQPSEELRDVAIVSFPNRLIPQVEMGTSPRRWQAIDEPLIAALQTSVIARYAAPARTGGYVAPILSGLWATAPYLHNGSVPTVWDLMHPAERPARFQVGGHRLDWAKLGIAGKRRGGDYLYPEGYVPWSEPELYDTSQPGLENTGHEREFADLTEDEKDVLLEYLKVL